MIFPQMKLFIILSFINIIFIECVSSAVTYQQRKIVCYYSGWAVYRNDPMSYDIEHIPGDLCTHIIYSFVGLDTKTYLLRSIDPEYDFEKSLYRFAYDS